MNEALIEPSQVAAFAATLRSIADAIESGVYQKFSGNLDVSYENVTDELDTGGAEVSRILVRQNVKVQGDLTLIKEYNPPKVLK